MTRIVQIIINIYIQKKNFFQQFRFDLKNEKAIQSKVILVHDFGGHVLCVLGNCWQAKFNKRALYSWFQTELISNGKQVALRIFVHLQ